MNGGGGTGHWSFARCNKRGLVLCFMDSGGGSMYQPAGVAGAWL